MKRSKIFLGATTCLLAIAGLAAAKMNTFRSILHRYYCTHVGTSIGTAGHCITYGLVNCIYDPIATNVCRYFTMNGIKFYTLYLYQTTAPTNTLCYKIGTTPVIADNCSRVVWHFTIE